MSASSRRRPPSSRGSLVAILALAAVGLSISLGLSGSASSAPTDIGCFGGPPIGPACGTLTEANLHSLVNDLTLAQKVGLVHGQGETTDPLTGCGNTGQPNAFPVINPGATGSALVAGCVGQAGVNNGVKSLGIPPLRQTDGPAGVRLSHQETGLPAPVGLTATFDRGAANAYGVVIGREGRATNQDVLYAPMINQVAFPTRRPQLRDARRGSVPRGRARRARDARRPGRGADRDAEAHGDERLRELAHEHGGQARRADAPRARAAGVREGDRGGPRGVDHVRVQPDQPVGHRPRHLLVRQQPAAEHDRARARSASRAGC